MSKNVLGYTVAELSAHLAKQFTPKMHWPNYATYWEVDHIKECAQFDLTNLDQCRMLRPGKPASSQDQA